jgi:hypothetical protein
MPGIEVLPDGKIISSKAIKYYIEGLDLLEGKYNLANENLSLSYKFWRNHHIKHWIVYSFLIERRSISN